MQQPIPSPRPAASFGSDPVAPLPAPRPAPAGAPGPHAGRFTEPFLGPVHVALARQALAQLRELRLVALEATTPVDWVDVGGRPYLQAPGALRIAAALGISLTELRVDATRETLGGRDVARFVAHVTARFCGRTLEAEGVSSSDDPFFSRRDGRSLALAEVPLNHVRKKAVTQALARGVKALLGLHGVTWEELRSIDIAPQKVPSVQYGRGAPARAPSPPPRAPSAPAPRPAPAPAPSSPQAPPRPAAPGRIPVASR